MNFKIISKIKLPNHIIFYLLFFSLNCGPTGIAGYVYDADEGQPIYQAKVTLKEISPRDTDITDQLGYFYVEYLRSGIDISGGGCYLLVEKNGYITFKVPFVESDNDIVKIDIYLQKE